MSAGLAQENSCLMSVQWVSFAAFWAFRVAKFHTVHLPVHLNLGDYKYEYISI